MKIHIVNIKNVKINSDYIRLDAFLKFLSLVSTGGEAKVCIQNGEVFVNGSVCLQRGKKLYNGNIIRFNGEIFRVLSDY